MSESKNGVATIDVSLIHSSQDAHELVESFKSDGFVIFERSLFSSVTLELLRERLARALRGEWDLGKPPTKAPKGIPPDFSWEVAAAAMATRATAKSPNAGSAKTKGGRRSSARGGRAAIPPPSPRTLHMINVSKCDAVFRELALSPVIGETVATLFGWRECGVRFAQDQVWVKPPCCGPLTFHRDTPYFDFEPKEVCTVWITFDATLEELQQGEGGEGGSVGPLEYCCGSHRWSTFRGSATYFFDPDFKNLVRSAAEHEGVDPQALRFVPVLVEAGGCAIHNGRTWHGSGPNERSDVFRRGIGMHYIRGDARFKPSSVGGKLGTMWAPLVAEDGSNVPPEEHFPFVFPPSLPSLAAIDVKTRLL